MVDKKKILAGRKAVDAYRKAHRQLHSKPWHRGIPGEHTPLLNIMVKAFKGLSFNTIQEFFDASDLANIQELGFASGGDFWDKYDEAGEIITQGKSTEADREALGRMWH